MADLLPGYGSIELIGQGARSTIHRVVHQATGKHYALKRVVRKEADDQRFIEQVETEFDVCSPLKHAHVRQCISIHHNKKWRKTQEVLMVMEYIEGATMENHRPNRIEHFCVIFRKIAAGLHALHQSGFVHADIKPDNIVLGHNGVVKVIDLGQSCPIGHKKKRIQGTPDFIAPEQVRRINLDQRTDVYNLGATMYWALTGINYPTEMADSTTSKTDISRASAPQSPKELNDKFPLALSQLVMDCCKSNPNDRPPDMVKLDGRLKTVQTLWRRKLEELKAKKQADQAENADSVE
ncbi:MAG: serine/threonine protein kinase [Planctomycetes bacterium]|nr:serine/threonine protein kinase [Planctomycetota bacterium]